MSEPRLRLMKDSATTTEMKNEPPGRFSRSHGSGTRMEQMARFVALALDQADQKSYGSPMSVMYHLTRRRCFYASQSDFSCLISAPRIVKPPCQCNNLEARQVPSYSAEKKALFRPTSPSLRWSAIAATNTEALAISPRIFTRGLARDDAMVQSSPRPLVGLFPGFRVFLRVIYQYP